MQTLALRTEGYQFPDMKNMKNRHAGPQTRITSLQNRMKDADIDVVLLDYSRSILYYAGTTQPSILTITPEDYHLTVIRGMEWVMEETWLKLDKIRPGHGYTHAKERLTDWQIEKGSLGIQIVKPFQIELASPEQGRRSIGLHRITRLCAS